MFSMVSGMMVVGHFEIWPSIQGVEAAIQQLRSPVGVGEIGYAASAASISAKSISKLKQLWRGSSSG